MHRHRRPLPIAPRRTRPHPRLLAAGLLVGTAACSSTPSTPSAPAGPDPAAVVSVVRLKPVGREAARERTADGTLRVYFVLPKPPGGGPGSSMTAAYTPDLNRHAPVTGATPFNSYAGPHPDTGTATCTITAWRSDAGVASFTAGDTSVTWDAAAEIGVVVSAACASA